MHPCNVHHFFGYFSLLDFLFPLTFFTLQPPLQSSSHMSICMNKYLYIVCVSVNSCDGTVVQILFCFLPLGQYYAFKIDPSCYMGIKCILSDYCRVWNERLSLYFNHSAIQTLK